MRTLIRKELRENFKVALIGFALFAFILFENYRNCAGFTVPLLDGRAGPVTPMTGFLCAIFGAILGWLQIHNERHRDLWAFLVHRPLSRSKIFLAKTVAGFCLYTLGAGLPLLGLIILTAMPGHFAAPFEWVMVLPVLACFLAGFVCYFAGMLTGLRQARWYVSRGLGLGAAFVVCLAVSNAPEFSRALRLILVGGAVLATAAWGSFLSGGCYEGQPGLGRRALVVSLTLGCLVVVGFALALLEYQFHWPPIAENTGIRYQITKDGAIYKITQPAGKPEEITELNAGPFKDAMTGPPVTETNIYLRAAPQFGVQPVFLDLSKGENWSCGVYQQSIRYFYLWRQTTNTLWYWNRNGRLWGYDTASRRFIGSLGPDGFAPGNTSGTARFTWTEGPIEDHYHGSASFAPRTLMTDHAVYLLDLDHRVVKPLYVATNNDRIGWASDVSLQLRWYPDWGPSWDYTIVVTTNFVSLLTPDGNLVWQTPYTPTYPAYNDVEVSFLESSNRFALCFHPANQVNKTNNLPAHYVWLTASLGALTNLDVPSPIAQTWIQPWTKQLEGLGLPPVGLPGVDWLDRRVKWTLADFLLPELQLSLVMAVVCAIAGWCLGRRYHFTSTSQLKWAVFHLLTGLPGLLGFLCVQEWPAREPCPNCQKLRLVNREKCEFCGAGFAPPPKNGTEIFEPASTPPR
jgi:hypothetical protein